MSLCKEQPAVVIVTDEASAERSLTAGSMSCPSCSDGSLRPWGFARSRVLRGCAAPSWRYAPRRARCPNCGATHVLLPGDAPPRRADTVQVVLTALLAHHDGAGAGSITADLGVPVGTARSWLRTVTGRADWLREQATRWARLLDPQHPPVRPTGSRLGDALRPGTPPQPRDAG